jgi:hypothetical protein
MDWTYLRPRLARDTALAVVAAGLVAAVSWVPVAAALASLLFSWPVASLIVEWIGSRVPDAKRREPVPVPRRVLLGWLALWAGVSTAVAISFHEPVLSVAAVVLVCVAPVGALLGIAAEAEDSAPGGFNNPR